MNHIHHLHAVDDDDENSRYSYLISFFVFGISLARIRKHICYLRIYLRKVKHTLAEPRFLVFVDAVEAGETNVSIIENNTFVHFTYWGRRLYNETSCGGIHLLACYAFPSSQPASQPSIHRSLRWLFALDDDDPVRMVYAWLLQVGLSHIIARLPG